MSSTKNLRYLAVITLAVLIFSILLTAFIGLSTILVYISFLFTIAVWIYVLFGGTNGLALNFPGRPVSSGGKLLSFLLFSSVFAFSFYYVYLVYGTTGEVAISLFVLLVLKDIFRNAKTCGYSIIAPLTFVGGAQVGQVLYSLLVPSGLAFAVASLLAVILVCYVTYRFRARTGPNYALSVLFIGLTAFGIYSQANLLGLWPYCFLFLSLVLFSLMFAHGNILVGPLDLGSPFRRIRGGSILLLLSVLFFIFGLYRVLSPAFSPAITNAAVLSSAWAEGIMQAFGLLMLALMLFLTLAMIGSKQSLPIAYGFLVVFSAYGLFGMVQTSITGVWAPTAETAAIVWIIVAVLLFYEPTFRFINNYTAVPFSFSLEYKLRINKNLIMGRYDITHGRRIDTGGFAIIYEGLDVLTNGEVILKEPKANPNDTDAVESLQYAIKQLEKESDVLKTLDFPGIVKYVDFFQEGGRYFMVEERIYGRTLGEISRKGRLQFSQPEAIMYTLEVLYALNYLHMHGELHRDLSCNNVMITSQGKIKLIDFGLAKKMVRMATTGFHRGQTGAPGTDGYCAPERDQALLLGEVSLSFPYDIYSVGALMYLMLSGDHPPLVVVSNTVDAALGGKCDARIVSVVKKAMAIDPQDRYQSAFEMIAAINDYKGRFIVTDFTEVYDLTGCSQAELLNDPSYKPVPGKLFRGVVDKIHLETTKKNMSAGSITLNKNVNQYELVAEKGVSFNILSKDLEKEGVKKYFLGKNALFWLDEGHRTCRNGVFSYVEV